jgi:cytochrome c5
MYIAYNIMFARGGEVAEQAIIGFGNLNAYTASAVAKGQRLAEGFEVYRKGCEMCSVVLLSPDSNKLSAGGHALREAFAQPLRRSNAA